MWPFNIIRELREEIRELEERLRCRPRRGVNYVIGDSLQEVIAMSITNFNILPGASRWISAAFEDASGVVRPLAALPTGADTSATPLLVATPVGAGGAIPAIGDPRYYWKLDCPADAVVGTTGTFTMQGTNPDGTVDKQDVPYTVNAPDDTVVDVEIQDQAP